MSRSSDAEIVTTWLGHKFQCAKCQKYDGSTVSLAEVCPQGAPLIKNYLAAQSAPLVAKARRRHNQILKRQFAGDLYSIEPLGRGRAKTKYVGE
jgi:hypothetical protein